MGALGPWATVVGPAHLRVPPCNVKGISRGRPIGERQCRVDCEVAQWMQTVYVWVLCGAVERNGGPCRRAHAGVPPCNVKGICVGRYGERRFMRSSTWDARMPTRVS